MMTMQRRRGLTRRELLATAASAGAFMVGAGFVAHPSEAWAVESKTLQPRTLATLIQVARDIYPHDQIADRFYAAAVKSHDEKAGEDDLHRALIEDGIATLDTMAKAKGHGSYLDIGWEADRVDMLRSIDDSPFFQAVRGGLVVGLYNQQEVWALFGYEGESYSKGGYLDRGFDDIAWI